MTNIKVVKLLVVKLKEIGAVKTRIKEVNANYLHK